MRHTRLLFCLFALLLTPGCLSSAPMEEHFYNLTGPSVPMEQGTGPTLAVHDFSAAPGYDTPRLAYRLSPNELRFYAHHKWAAEPAVLVRAMVTNHLRASGQFARVEYESKRQEPDAYLTGTLVALEEIDAREGWQGRLAMRLELHLSQTDEVVLREGFDVSAPCKEHHPREVARAVSEALAKKMKALAPRLADAIRGVTTATPPAAEPAAAVPQPTPAPAERVKPDGDGGK